jgi:hypothetical protein
MINGFTVESKMRKKYAKDIEDSYGFDSGKGIMAVADGVTRDPMPVLPDLKTEEGMREFNENYSKPSPAKIAADIFSKEFVEFMKKAGLCVGSVREAFEKANSAIRKWNDENMPEVDYLVSDFAGAVAAGAVVDGKKFFYGFICDCGVVVFDRNGRVKFKTEDEGPDVLDKFIWRSDFMKGQSWRMPEGRRRLRSHFRNNPKLC